MKILVTGGAGYIGSMLVPLLLRSNYFVTVLDNFMYGQSSLNQLCGNRAFDVVRGDCRDERITRELLAKADVVIPLAAIVGAPACEADQAAAHSINCGAVIDLLRMMAPAQRMLIPITNSGYGIGRPGEPCTEDSELKPLTTYGHTKVAAELAALQSGKAIAFRLATVFGMSPRMRIDLLVNDFVHRAVNDRALVLFEAKFKRNYLHVVDAARVFAHGITHFEAMRGRAFNVGLDDANLSKLELCEAIARHVKGFAYLEAPIGEDPDKRDYIVSNARILATGFRTSRSLDDGIAELVKGYRMLRNRVYGNA